MDELCAWWVGQLAHVYKKTPEDLKTPGELYAGISFDVVTEIAEVIGHDNVYVVNRGAGLVRHTDKMVPYDFTYDPKDPNSAANKVKGEKFMPHMWWSKINHALHEEAFPISKLRTADDKAYDFIIVALPKNFLKMVSRDLEQVPEFRQRLLIPAPRSSCSAVTRAVRPTCIPYTNAYTADVEHNRFNKTQKMAQKFLTLGLAEGNLQRHAEAIRDAQNALDGKAASNIVSYKEMFEANPQLLEALNPLEAMNRAKLLGLRIGSRTKFIGAWKGAKGHLEIEVEPEELESAKESLATIMSQMGNKYAQTDSEVLERIGVFIEAIRALNPDMLFTSKEVAAWGALNYKDEEDTGKKKTGIKSSGKVSSLLSSHTAYLGLEEVPVGTKSAYRIKVS
jgi:hypothetical protein